MAQRDTSNHPPEVALELTAEMAEFIVETCEANERLYMGYVQKCAAASDEEFDQLRAVVEKLQPVNERYKELKRLVTRAMGR